MHWFIPPRCHAKTSHDWTHSYELGRALHLYSPRSTGAFGVPSQIWRNWAFQGLRDHPKAPWQSQVPGPCLRSFSQSHTPGYTSPSPPPRLVGRYFYLFVFLTPKKRRPTSPVATIPPTFQGRGSPKLSPFVALSVISEGGFRHVAASSPRKGAWCYMWLLGMMDTPTLCPKGPGRADKCSFEQNNKSRPQIPEGDVLSQRLSAPQALKCLRGGAETSLLHWVSPGKLGTPMLISMTSLPFRPPVTLSTQSTVLLSPHWAFGGAVPLACRALSEPHSATPPPAVYYADGSMMWRLRAWDQALKSCSLSSVADKRVTVVKFFSLNKVLSWGRRDGDRELETRSRSLTFNFN